MKKVALFYNFANLLLSDLLKTNGVYIQSVAICCFAWIIWRKFDLTDNVFEKGRGILIDF
jgi:hypothetical protein